MEQYTILRFTNQKDYRFSLDRRRRLFVASKLKNSCFTCSITHPATTLTFSPADALFLDNKSMKQLFLIMFMHMKNYRTFWMVQDGSSMRSSYPESCIHGLSPDVVSVEQPQFGHTNSVGAPLPAKSITTKSCIRPYPTRPLRQHFGGQIRLVKLSFIWFYLWHVLCHPPPPFHELT